MGASSDGKRSVWVLMYVLYMPWCRDVAASGIPTSSVAAKTVALSALRASWGVPPAPAAAPGGRGSTLGQQHGIDWTSVGPCFLAAEQRQRQRESE